MGLFSWSSAKIAGAVAWKVFEKALEVPKKVYEAVGAVSGIIKTWKEKKKEQQKEAEVKEGNALQKIIYQYEEERKTIIRSCQDGNEFIERMNYTIERTFKSKFTVETPVDTRIIMDIAKNPNQYGIIQGELLNTVKNLDRYQITPLSMPYIFHDTNSDLIIGLIPTQVFKYNFVHPWETPLTLKRLEIFGIRDHHIMPEVSHWFNMLDKADQIYFSQLYKDYYEFAKQIGQQDILSLTEFCQKLYTKRNEKLREVGASAMTFDLRAKSDGNKLQRVYIVARPIGGIINSEPVI